MKYKYITIQYALLNITNMVMCSAMIGYIFNYLSSLRVLMDAQGNPNTTLIGYIIACGNILGLIGQSYFGAWLDRTTIMDEKGFLRLISIVSLITGIGMLVIPDTLFIVVVLAVLTCAIVNICMPVINTVAFIYEKDGTKINYGLCRGIGSAAYAIGAFFLGRLWVTFGKNTIPFYIIIFSIIAILVLTSMPNVENTKKEVVEKNDLSYGAFFKKYKAAILLAVGMIGIYFTHQMINVYLKVIIEGVLGEQEILARIQALPSYDPNALNVGSEAYNIAKDSIIAKIQGTAVFVAAMSELPPMFLFSKIIKKFDINKVMVFAAGMYLVKHIMFYLCKGEVMLYFVHFLQMLGYAVMLPALVYWVNENILESDRNKGQSIMMMTLTIGGLFANITCGYLFDTFTVKTVLLIGVIATIVGVVLIYSAVSAKKEKGLMN